MHFCEAVEAEPSAGIELNLPCASLAWRREGVSRPGRSSLLPPSSPQSDLQLIFLWLRRQNKVLGQSIPDSRFRNIEDLTTDCRQSEHRYHEATGAGRAECPSTVQICYSVEWSKVLWRCVVQNLALAMQASLSC